MSLRIALDSNPWSVHDEAVLLRRYRADCLAEGQVPALPSVCRGRRPRRRQKDGATAVLQADFSQDLIGIARRLSQGVKCPLSLAVPPPG